MANYSNLRNSMVLRIDTDGKTANRSYHIKEGATADEVWHLATTIAGLMTNTVNEVRETDYHSVTA